MLNENIGKINYLLPRTVRIWSFMNNRKHETQLIIQKKIKYAHKNMIGIPFIPIESARKGNFYALIAEWVVFIA